jgi:uncharacterized protein YdaT
MPWTPQEFKERHAKDLSPAQARKAAAMANAMLKSGTAEGTAIATAIKRAKQSGGETLYPKKG